MNKLTFADKVWYMCEGALMTLIIFAAITTLSLGFLFLL